MTITQELINKLSLHTESRHKSKAQVTRRIQHNDELYSVIEELKENNNE